MPPCPMFLLVEGFVQVGIGLYKEPVTPILRTPNIITTMPGEIFFIFGIPTAN